MTNKTEQIAIDVVIKYEKKEGRNPKIVSGQKGKHWDMESGNRLIEVKGLGARRSFDFSLEVSLFELPESVKNKYYIYVVYNIGEETKLKILSPDRIFENLERYEKAWIPPAKVKQLGEDFDISKL